MGVVRSALHLRELDVRTIASAGTAGGCCACDSTARVRMTAPPYALGASPLELDDYLAGIPLCGDCAVGSTHAVRAFGRLLYLVPMLPLVATVAVMFLAPLSLWSAGALYVLSLLAAGASLRALRSKRARLAPALIVEARGRTLVLQVAAAGVTESAAGGPYRAPGVVEVGVATHPRPPDDHLGLTAPAMAIVGAALAFWAWFFANPLVVLDNAASVSASVQIDDGEVRAIAGFSRQIVRVHIGSHVVRVRPSVGAEERIEVSVAVGRDQLFAVGDGCYHLASQRTTRAHRWSTLAWEQTTERTTSSRWIAIGDPLDVVPVACPQGALWPRR